MLNKIFLLPLIHRGIEFRLKGEVLGRAGVEELIELLKGAAIVGLADFPGFPF